MYNSVVYHTDDCWFVFHAEMLRIYACACCAVVCDCSNSNSNNKQFVYFVYQTQRDVLYKRNAEYPFTLQKYNILWWQNSGNITHKDCKALIQQLQVPCLCYIYEVNETNTLLCIYFISESTKSTSIKIWEWSSLLRAVTWM